MNLVAENINDVLKPKSKADVEESMGARIEELQGMDIEEMLEGIVSDFSDYGPIDEHEVAKSIIMNVDIQERKYAIALVYRTFAFYLANIE